MINIPNGLDSLQSRRSFAVCLLLCASTCSAQFPQFLDGTVLWNRPTQTILPRVGVGLPKRSDVQPVLLFVPGQIFGSYDPDLGYFPLASAGARTFGFPLELIASVAATIAQPLSENLQEQGLSIAPFDARLLRVATYFFWNTDRGRLQAGLREKGTEEILILVYVDRACAITGAETIGTLRYSYDLTFDSAGLHAIPLNTLRERMKQRHVLTAGTLALASGAADIVNGQSVRDIRGDEAIPFDSEPPMSIPLYEEMAAGFGVPEAARWKYTEMPTGPLSQPVQLTDAEAPERIAEILEEVI